MAVQEMSVWETNRTLMARALLLILSAFRIPTLNLKTRKQGNFALPFQQSANNNSSNLEDCDSNDGHPATSTGGTRMWNLVLVNGV
jgi:hypothetical protein